MQELEYIYTTNYSDELINSIRIGFSKCFENTNVYKMSNDEWKNKLSSSPFGNSISIIALKDSNVCGFISFGMYKTIINGKIYNSAISNNTFVIPEFRGLGVFNKLLKLSNEAFIEYKIDFLFNFPNSNSLKGFINNGWIYKKDLCNYYVKLTKYSSLFKIIKLVLNKSINKKNEKLFQNGSSINQIDNINYQIDHYNNNSIGVFCTKEFLKWRFTKGSIYNDYRIESYNDSFIIYKVINRQNLLECSIMFFYASNNNLSEIKYIIKKIKKVIQPDFISIIMSNEHQNKNIVSQNQFINFSFLRKSNFTYYIIDNEIENIINNAKWNITTIDFHTS